MGEANKTREVILRRAAELFNQQGYAGASIADIMQATGLKKGGIYNHFTSKEQLWLESFDYAYQLVTDYFNNALREKKHAVDRLLCVIDCFQRYAEEPVLQGGCPLLNTAIESDHTNPILRERVRLAFTELGELIERIVQRGLERGQLRPGTDPQQVASVFLTTLEGAVMLSQLYDNPIHMHHAADHLSQYVQLQLQKPDPSVAPSAN
jgi:AcrR family transcriptional regulator